MNIRVSIIKRTHWIYDLAIHLISINPNNAKPLDRRTAVKIRGIIIIYSYLIDIIIRQAFSLESIKIIYCEDTMFSIFKLAIE